MNQRNPSVAQWLRVFVIAAVMFVPAIAAAQSQTPVTASDIQRLQDDVYQAGSDLSRLRSSNPESASRLQSQLDELRDEVIYLKVRLRREGSVPRTDYLEVRDRVQALRADARGDTTTERRGAWTGGSAGGTAGGVVRRDERRRERGRPHLSSADDG